MDRIGTHHGHNLAVTDPVITAHPKRKYYRLGVILTQQDFYRAAFPNAQHWMVKEHPANLPADTRIDPYNDSVDFVKSRYFPDIALADVYTPFKAEFDAKFALSLVSDWTIGDRIHLSVPTGVDQEVSVIEATLNAMPLTQRIAPPILKVRPAILPSANLLPNGDYSQWSGGLPTGWTVWGDAVVSQDGGMVKVTSAGHGGIECTISAIALRDKIVTLNAVMEIAESVNLNAGGVAFLTDKVGANIGDGRWFNAPYRCYDALRGFTHLFPVDAEGIDANAGKPSTLTVRIAAASNYGGATGAGEIRLARAVLVEGDEPRDLVGAALALPPSAVARVSNEPVYSQIYTLPASLPSAPARGARVKFAADQTAQNYSGAPSIQWSAEDFDTDGCHDNAVNPSRLTVPAGYTKARVEAGVYLSSMDAAQSPILLLRKNGATIAGSQGYNAGSVWGTTQTSGLINVTAGDYFQAVLSTTDTSVDLVAARSFFSIELFT
jgi:hypothetical protein